MEQQKYDKLITTRARVRKMIELAKPRLIEFKLRVNGKVTWERTFYSKPNYTHTFDIHPVYLADVSPNSPVAFEISEPSLKGVI